MGRHCFLAFGPDGRPAISYQDYANEDLKFAERLTNGSWSVLPPIDAIGSVGGGTSMALNLDGHLAISYLDEANNDLKYVERLANGHWSVTLSINTDDYIEPVPESVNSSWTWLPR